LEHKVNILIVEAENLFAVFLEKQVKDIGYNAAGSVSSGEEAIEFVKHNDVHLILMNIKLKGKIDGIACAEIINSTQNIPIIILSGAADQETVKRVSSSTAFNFLPKPVDEKNLSVIIPMTLSKHSIAKKLSESEKRFRMLTECSLAGVYIIQDNKFRYVNPAFLSLFGYSEAEVIDKLGPGDFAYPESRHIIEKNIELRLAGKEESIHYSFKAVKKDSSVVFCEVLGRRIDYEGKPAIIGTLINVTDQKNYEKELLIAKEEAERSNKLKTEFLSHISHEIRTPINNILAYISLLKEEVEDKLPKDLESCFEIIDKSSARLIKTIDLLLNLSKIQTGNFEVKYEPVDLAGDILDNVYIEFYNKAKEKKLDLIFSSAITNSTIIGDKYSLTQIFANLVDNAIKYTSEGKIEMLLYNDEESKKICVDVKDTGVGMTRDYLPKIFTPYARDSNSAPANFDGTGLGLSLVKSYIKLNNGEINVQSEKDSGTTFTVKFPEKN
jgi:PAS domain S-box-containing protein